MHGAEYLPRFDMEGELTPERLDAAAALCQLREDALTGEMQALNLQRGVPLLQMSPLQRLIGVVTLAPLQCCHPCNV